MEAISREVVVRFRRGTPAAIRRSARELVGTVEVERPGIPGLEVLRLGRGRPVASAVAALEAFPQVLYAEPNFLVRAAGDEPVPNDPHFGLQWGLRNTGQSGGLPGADVDMLPAWAAARAEEPDPIVVAVTDTGIQADHPDLAGVVLEAGKSWTTGGPPATRHLTDRHGHGTHVAGIVGAVRHNEIGIAGVSPHVALMSLQVLDRNGLGAVSDVASAFHHAGELGVPIVNASLVWPQWSQAAHDAIADHPGTLYVVAAGNDGTDNDGPNPSYPCTFQLPNIVCVTATDRFDTRPSFANVGASTVDLGAPGRDVVSTLPAGYGSMSGTSMAAPHVAGVAALVLAELPEATGPQVKESLLRSVDPLVSMEKTASVGRLNAATALAAAQRLLDEGATTTGAFLSSFMDVRPRRAFQPARGFVVLWSGDGDRHDVRSRAASTGSGFGPPRVFVLDAPQGEQRFVGKLGMTYCFGARTRDADGVTSPWGEERCTAIPVNDAALARRGTWVRFTGRDGYFQRSYSQAKRRGSELVLTGIRGARRVALVATRCPRCGAVDVLWRGERVRRVSLRATKVQRMRIIRLPVDGNGRLVLRVASNGRPVRIEGVGVSRV